MKRISQNKFASSLFSCLGVAACVAFSSCGKKDNDKFKSADEFKAFLQDKVKELGVIIDYNKLTQFANNNWETASKKTFKVTKEIQKQIAGEDLDNEDEEMTGLDQSRPEQQNQGTEQTTLYKQIQNSQNQQRQILLKQQLSPMWKNYLS